MTSHVSLKNSLCLDPWPPRGLPYASKVQLKVQQQHPAPPEESDSQHFQPEITHCSPKDFDTVPVLALDREEDLEMGDCAGEIFVEERVELREEVEVNVSTAEDEEEAYHNPNPDNATRPVALGGMRVRVTQATALSEIRDILMPLFDDDSENLSSFPPDYLDDIHTLSDMQQLTLDKFRIWHRNNEKEASYEDHRQNWILRDHEMHTLGEAKKMLADLSSLTGDWLPMCGASCSSYLGKNESLDRTFRDPWSFFAGDLAHLHWKNNVELIFDSNMGSISRNLFLNDGIQHSRISKGHSGCHRLIHLRQLAWQHQITEEERLKIQDHFATFVKDWEKIYVHAIALDSFECPLEGMIGYLKKRINQDNKYQENLVNQALLQEQLNIIDIFYPSSRNAVSSPRWTSIPLTKLAKLRGTEYYEEWMQELTLIRAY
ncbi:hypothetical protein BT69DRAFT_1297308 [Atractiella rhizophila]|nr:hypothetical protein BT69DRAFT_1297308 [Atractiella rhizophila]